MKTHNLENINYPFNKGVAKIEKLTQSIAAYYSNNMRVKNIEDTVNKPCKWLYWKYFSEGQSGVICSAKGCYDNNVIGAHVYKENDTSEYIVPLCKKHQQQEPSRWFEIETRTNMVPAEMD